MHYLFYETDPGVPVPDPTDTSRPPDKNREPPEWAWWEFNVDDFTAGRADFMMSITDATDPDLKRFLIDNNGKLILNHGWVDTLPPEPTLDHYKDIVATTFMGDMHAARDRIRLFMFPGMGHCGGGPGPNTRNVLEPLVDWVENGKAPDFVVATHSTDGVVDNERRICAYPELAVYTGPVGGENYPANWVESNFTCQ
jgi:feruloyl esterase